MSFRPILKCPRCTSRRVADRVDGGHRCLRCGQRWKGAHLEKSADKRERGAEHVSAQYAFPSFSLYKK